MNIDKLIQSVNYLLKKYDYSLNYTKLIKELYLADRQSIKQTGWSITADTYKNMPYGPVLTGLYTLIQGKHADLRSQSKWDSCFLTDSKDLKAKTTIIPEGELSESEKKILDDIDSVYHDFSYFQMINVVHDQKICPEWKDPHGSSTPLSKKDIMKALGFEDSAIDFFEEETQVFDYEEAIFASLEDA